MRHERNSSGLIIAVGRTKLFLGGGKGAALTRVDLATGAVEKRATQKTAATARGAVPFTLEAGPSVMTITREGVLTWPQSRGE